MCDKGSYVYYAGYKDENFVSLIGIACAKVDRINILGMFQRSLVKSEASRENSSYFSTLILQKRLIYQFMIDNLNLSHLKLPSSRHLLSRVFDALSDSQYKVISTSPKLVEINTNGRKYILSVSDDEPKKVLVDEYKADGKLERHWYQ
ncbi:hypothetical protein JHD50_12425 [Sulfurimonas sp. MAG313]|nr:hypothetical protein [Sulfurimonas sp. MAG313]MDF1882094.1 hypothetical protein [Sulfurimonas sp. MAG313]